MSLGCLWCSESLGLVSGRFFSSFFFLSCRTPCSLAGQGWGKTPLSAAQSCRFFVVVQFRPADALLSPEPGGIQSTLFARNLVQGYVRVCVSFCFVIMCFICSILLFRLNRFPPSGIVPSIPGICRLVIYPLPCRWSAGDFWHDFFLKLAPGFRPMSTRSRLAIVHFLWLVCRRAFPFPPPPHQQYAAGSRAISDPPPPRHIGGTWQRFDRWFLPCCRFCDSLNLISSRVPGSIAKPLEVWGLVLRRRIFDSWPSS